MTIRTVSEENNKVTKTNTMNDKQKVRIKRVSKNSKGKSKRRREESEFDKRIVSIRRVTRVYEGGKRMRLSVCLVVGDRKGKIGIGIGKGADVRSAEEKAYNYALKHLKTIPLVKGTVPHQVLHKKGAAKVFMKPAAPGTGIVAGSSLRAVLEVAGVKNILTKILGTSNQINNAYAAVEALSEMKNPKDDVKYAFAKKTKTISTK